MPGADAEDTPCLLQEGYLLGQSTHSPEREQEAGDGPVVAQVLLMRMLALPGSFWDLHLLLWSGCCRGWRSHSCVSVPHWVSASLRRPAPSLPRLQTVKELACPFLKFIPTVRNSYAQEEDKSQLWHKWWEVPSHKRLPTSVNSYTFFV